MNNKKVSPIEYEFRLMHGCYPYDYAMRQIKNGLSYNEAFAKTQSNIDKVWKNMKHSYERNNASH